MKRTHKEEVHERLEMPLERLLSVEHLVSRLRNRETVIQELFRSWRLGAPAPVHVVETAAADPMLYRLPNHNGRFTANWPTRVLKDFPALTHARLCASEYALCRRNGTPIAHYIHHSYGSVRREYLRLIVPLDGTRLAYQYRLISED